MAYSTMSHHLERSKMAGIWRFLNMEDKTLYMRMSPAIRDRYDSWVRSDARGRTSLDLSSPAAKGYQPSTRLWDWLCEQMFHEDAETVVQMLDTEWIEGSKSEYLFRSKWERFLRGRDLAASEISYAREKVKNSRKAEFFDNRRKLRDMGLPVAALNPDLDEIITLAQDRYRTAKQGSPFLRKLMERPVTAVVCFIGIAMCLYALGSSINTEMHHNSPVVEQSGDGEIIK